VMIDYLVFYPLELVSRIVTAWYRRRLARMELNSLAYLDEGARIGRRGHDRREDLAVWRRK